ncbi:Uu.00g083730.m01.CDS01 [Anthostomella pinea]|uniref:Uu.00g083730.m01.CDS01 n=1 Tax=Anthostomella pinea TaxID=933095 RepID=A0AAI8YJN5_9PEZI|nr:Uu.00g083730.m01.CDS01 [Anthostomella pinea]
MNHSHAVLRQDSPVDIERERTAARSDHPDSPIDASARLDDEELDSDDSPTPRFMQEEGAWKRWRWIPYPARKLGKTVYRWMKGPQPPRIWKIDPFFPTIQHAPLTLIERLLPNKKHRQGLFLAYFAAWILTFAIVLWQGQVSSEVQGWGQPSDISCGVTYWTAKNGCGLDGMDCRPFNGSGFAFRCPSNCGSYRVLNPRAVGQQEIVYAPLVIGGPPDATNEADPVYRGDSFICGSAIHSGVISNSDGGCGVVELIGEQQNYVSTNRHGINSVGFDSYFPLSFTFLPGIKCEARDARWSLLAVSAVFTSILSLFTASSAAFFFANFIIIFWQVGMASDPPSETSVAGLFSDIIGKFLPALFCAWVMYDKMGVRRTLRGLTAQVEKTVLWLCGCWVGALTNYTFDFIPIQRLTGHDLDQQPGAKAALAVIVVVIAVIVVGQVWCFQQEARLLRVLKLYAVLVLAIIIAVVLPSLSLRIHHYILALLLLPGTSMQTRPSLLYQGILIGLFINGIARWGFDAVLQTSSALQGDAQLGSALPVLNTPDINVANSSIIFGWNATSDTGYDGVSVLVNDVERYRGFFGDEDADQFVWSRDNGSSYDEYFRFGYVLGTSTGDYTKAGVWTAELDWIEMAAGPSRIKSRDLRVDENEQVPRALWNH